MVSRVVLLASEHFRLARTVPFNYTLPTRCLLVDMPVTVPSGQDLQYEQLPGDWIDLDLGAPMGSLESFDAESLDAITVRGIRLESQ